MKRRPHAGLSIQLNDKDKDLPGFLMANVLFGSAALNMIPTSGLLLVSAQLQLTGVGMVGL